MINSDTIITSLGDRIVISWESDKRVISNKDHLLSALKHQEDFLLKIDAKLSNARFLENAKPEVIEREKNKKADIEKRISILKNEIVNHDKVNY